MQPLLLHGSVEQRERISVADVREVILELQEENLAAGDALSDLDFAVEDVYEDDAVEDAAAQVQITAAGTALPFPGLSAAHAFN